MSQSGTCVVIFPVDGSSPLCVDGSAKDTKEKWINLLDLGQPTNPINLIEMVPLQDDIIAFVNEEGAFDPNDRNPHCPYLFGPIVVTKGSWSLDGEWLTQDITINEAKNALSYLMPEEYNM